MTPARSGREILARDARNVVARREHHALEVVVADVPIAERLPFGEVVRLPFHVLEAADPARLEDSLRALDLVVADLAVAHRADLGPDGARRVRSRGGRRLGVSDEHADLRRRVVIRAHRRRETPLAHRAIEPRRAPGAEHAGEQLERRGVSAWFVPGVRHPNAICVCAMSPVRSR